MVSVTSSAPPFRLVLRSLLRLDLKELYLARRRSRIVDAAYRTAAQLEKIGRKKRRFRIVACPPLNLWLILMPLSRGDPSRIIHQAYLRGLWRERGTAARAGLVVGVVLWSLPLHLLSIAWMTAINGPAISRLRGKSIPRLVVEQLQLAFLHNIMAPWYYQLELHDDAKRRQASAYVHRFELKGGLYRFVNSHLGQPGRSMLSNKGRFEATCRQAGIPTLPLVGTVRDGELVDAEGRPSDLPPGDLFAKPNSGRGGSGAEVWRYVGDDAWTDDTRTLPRDALRRHLVSLARAEPYLVQKRAEAHPDIADLSNGALPTVRVLTIKGEGARHETVAAAFRMAIGENRKVDNYHAGGIAALVDLETGRLGQASDVGLAPDIGWLDRHPDTNGTITGRQLPHWPRILEVAERAHDVFPQRLVVGWDIAILCDGPALVEGNGAPDTDLHQRQGPPLGGGRFGLLFAALILQVLDDMQGIAW